MSSRDFPKMSHLKFHPEKYLSDFPKNQKEDPQKKFDATVINASLYLEHWRSKFEKIEIALRAKRKEIRGRRSEMKVQWNEIRTKCQHLKTNFVSFNQFLIANKDKRKRAQENIQINKKLLEDRQDTCDKLKEKVKFLSEAKIELDKYIRDYSLYERYLDEVLDVEDIDLKSIGGIIEKYEDHTELGQQLAVKQAKEFSILQNAKNNLLKFIEQNESCLLDLHTKAAGLQGRYEQATRRTRQLEVLISHIKAQSISKYTDAKQTLIAIWNLYQKICRKKRQASTIPKEDFENQLVYISRALRDYQKLNGQLRIIFAKSKPKEKK